jgi:hypothetical protein
MDPLQLYSLPRRFGKFLFVSYLTGGVMTSVVDPDRHPGLADPGSLSFQPNVKLNYAFFCPKYYHFDPYDADEKV